MASVTVCSCFMLAVPVEPSTCRVMGHGERREGDSEGGEGKCELSTCGFRLAVCGECEVFALFVALFLAFFSRRSASIDIRLRIHLVGE